ncbi:nuclear receptor-binding factor 2-like [Prorops nasuta]|uniref:nuclear receptor-binding factor 2-like n=1 Tax=Prorops nasuta TaxID=863751 RepID=UPI0034CFFEB7
METSALNLAHERQRRADALLREGKFEEAAKCHEMAASLLGDAQNQIESSFVHLRTSNSSSHGSPSFVNSLRPALTLESLALQRDHHQRQAAIVRMKQAQYEEYKAALENQQRNLYNKPLQKQSNEGNSTDPTQEKFDGSLRQAIYRTIEEQDSLLSLISFPEENKVFKHPKDTGTVIEELRTVNCQLRNLVGSLLSQLEVKEEEVRQLTERLLEFSANKPEDSAVEKTYPIRLAPLPPLAPLEMPHFDFTSS